MGQWIKKKGLLLPDPLSYAESVNEFQDSFTGVLYISMGVKLTRKGGGLNDIFYPLNKMSGNYGYKIEFITARDTTYCNWFKLRYLWGTGSAIRDSGYVFGSQGGPQVIEVFHKFEQTLVAVINGSSKVGPGPYYGDPFQDALTKLRINPHPDSSQAIWIDHLVIGDKIPPWVNLDRLDDGSSCAIYPNYWADSHIMWWDKVPFGVDLDWAIKEGLIDPTEFLHFYTFEELDLNGQIPDYGSNPQPLALFGNAQISEGFELEPQFNPIVVYEVHALQTGADLVPPEMGADLEEQ